MNVAVGRAGSPTPTGRFAITDKLDGRSYGPLLRLLRAGAERAPAQHASGLDRRRTAWRSTAPTRPPRSERPASAGCLRAADADLRVLMAKVPLGTPVFIRP